MRRALAFFLVLIVGPAWAADPPRDRFSIDMAGAVFTTALEFIAPRALDPVTIQQLALWGLRGHHHARPGADPPPSGGERGAPARRDRAVPACRAGGEQRRGMGIAGDRPRSCSLGGVAHHPGAGGQALITSFFDEMFNHLDPYSRYVPPAAADVDRARRSGEAGAGVTLVRGKRGTFIVQTVNADGPAAEAGVVPGDQIIAVDDQPTRGEDLETVMEWITGLEGRT